MSDSPRLCGICRESPVGPGGQACPECFTRIDHTAKTNPYWWISARGDSSSAPGIDTISPANSEQPRR